MRYLIAISLIFGGLHGLTARANAPGCKGNLYIKETYKSCEHPSHPKLYAEKVSPACPAATFRSCRGKEARARENVVLRLTLTRYITDKCSNDGSQSWACTNGWRDFSDESVCHNVLVQKIFEHFTTKASGDFFKDEHSSLLDKSLAKSVSDDNRPYVIKGVGAPSGGPESNRAVTCEFAREFEMPVEGRYASCGGETFQSCRHPSHGEIGLSNIRSAACGLDPGNITLSSTPESRTGRSTCITLDSMPEGAAIPAWSKIAALRANLDLLAVSATTAPSTRDGSRARLTILGEIMRLSAKAVNFEEKDEGRQREIREKLSANLRAEMVPLIGAYGSTFESRTAGMSKVEAAFERAFSEKNPALAELVLLLNPKEAEELASKNITSFSTMSSERYAALYPRGVNYKKSVLAWAQERILTDKTTIYRVAEAAVRAELALLSASQGKLFHLLDLRQKILLPLVDHEQVLNELKSSVKENEFEDLRQEVEALKENNERLRRTIVTFLDAQVRIKERENARKLDTLWKFVAKASAQSNDPRFKILVGYRALVELDAPAYAQALQDAVAHLPYAPNPKEYLISRRLLTAAAGEYLSSLTNLRTLLDRSASRRERVEASLLGLIATPIENQKIPDSKLLRIVMDALTQYGDGGPGSDLALRAELRSMIDETYGEFMASLEKLNGSED